MQFTIVGDPHAVPGNLDKIGLLFEMIEDLGNPVILLGDLFDTKEIIRGRVFNFVHSKLESSKLNFIILVGNHDLFSISEREHSLKTLEVLPNVTIVDAPTRMEDLLFLPYYNSREEFLKNLEVAKARPGLVSKYLFIHQGMQNCDYGNGLIATGEGSGELAGEEIQGFKRVISGHFHKFQQKGNLTYLGSPFSHSFGETDQKKYIGIFDSATGEMELCETPFPRHRTVEIHLSDDKGENQGLIGSLNKVYNEPDRDDLWRVRLIGTEMQIAAFDKGAFPGVKFLDEPIDAGQVENANIKDTDSNAQKFSIWAKDIKGLDPLTIAEGLEILAAS